MSGLGQGFQPLGQGIGQGLQPLDQPLGQGINQGLTPGHLGQGLKFTTDAKGGNGGSPFSDKGHAGSPIRAIKLWTGKHFTQGQTIVVQIQAKYGDKWAEAHGTITGNPDIREYTFELNEGEHIVDIHGRTGSRVDELQFFTNEGRESPKYGGTGGTAFQVSGDGGRLYYIQGRSAKNVDNIQAVWVKEPAR